MTVVIIVGNLGSGKTIIMTLLTYNDKREVWSNYKINSKNYRKLEVPDLLNLKDNIVILMDEAYAWIESRVSSSSLNEHLSSVLFHTRKSNIDIYLTTPMFSAIDKRFRNQTDYIIFCQHRNNKDFDDFHFIIYDKHNNTYGKILLPYSEAKKYFKLYDTYEKVSSHRKNSLSFSILKKYPNRLKDYVNELTDLVRDKINGVITHPIVTDCLFMSGIDLAYEPLIYVRLKSGKKDYDNS